MNQKRFRILFLFALLCVLTLQGCAEKQKTKTDEEILAEMKEFSTPDQSAFICLESGWTEEPMEVGSFLTVGNENGSQVVFLFQFPKRGAFSGYDMEGIRGVIAESYHISESETKEAVTVPGMDGVETVYCRVSGEGASGNAILVYGETEYARYAMGYVTSGELTDEVVRSFSLSCQTFREVPPEEDDQTTVEMTDTVRWFGACYAVLTELNGWDYNRFCGLPANEESRAISRKLLESSWDVTDRATADDTLEWVLTEGHRTEFVENMEYLAGVGLSDQPEEERVGYILDNFDISAEEAVLYAGWYKMYEEFGAEAIDGWDFCRAINLPAYYYLAGYYTEQEALDKSLEIAEMIQPAFGSWDELIGSYLRGYEYWMEESSAERQAVYEDLKGREDSPYRVDYHTDLKKTW